MKRIVWPSAAPDAGDELSAAGRAGLHILGQQAETGFAEGAVRLGQLRHELAKVESEPVFQVLGQRTGILGEPEAVRPGDQVEAVAIDAARTHLDFLGQAAEADFPEPNSFAAE